MWESVGKRGGVRMREIGLERRYRGWRVSGVKRKELGKGRV